MPSNISIGPNDVINELEHRHRDAMLDLILAWGSLDGALGMLLSRVLGVPFDQGAERIGKLSSSARLEEVRKVLRDAPGGADAARMIKKHKKQYERHSFIRNRIAHSHCTGIWRLERDFIVFAAFEKVGTDEMAVDAIPIQEMQRATKWGQAMTSLALKLANISYTDDE